MDGEILFISDLHLDRAEPVISQNFEHFLKTRAAQARVLYILGDLFEIWLGDDDPAEEFSAVFDAIRKLSSNCDIYFLAGNRDFLVGQQLAKRLNIQIIEDGRLIELAGKRIALMHGDVLCSDDVEYQQFRQMVRSAQWQQQFLSRTLSERKAITDALRAQSKVATRQKIAQITDVNAQAVEQFFQHSQVDILIHGHTHRPAVHALPHQRQRIVLGDWQPQPSYLSFNHGEFNLVDVRIAH